MNLALLAAQRMAQSYQNKADSVDNAPILPIQIQLDGEVIGRLVAPTVSRAIAENLRRQRFTP